MFTAPLAITLSLAAATLAVFTPTEPSGTSVFNEGTTCSIKWVPDTTGAWTTTNIELMTGDNIGMIHLKNIATVDGSDPATTTYEYPCYAVEPNSAIYFYQFTSPNSTETVWTTRFTIADAAGATTRPANATQPVGGAAIPWGVGALEDPTLADTPPTRGSTITPGAGTSTTAASTSTSIRPASPTTAAGTATGATAGGSTKLVTSVSSSGTSTATATRAAQTGAASSSYSAGSLVFAGAAALAGLVMA